MRLLFLLAALHLSLVYSGCRGYVSEHPPVHINPNMDIQEKGKAYKESDFFENGQYMRKPIPGTIARGALKQDDFFLSRHDQWQAS